MAVPVLIRLLDDLLPDLVVAKLPVARAEDFLEFFRANLAVAVPVEVLEGDDKPLLFEDLIFVNA